MTVMFCPACQNVDLVMTDRQGSQGQRRPSWRELFD